LVDSTVVIQITMITLLDYGAGNVRSVVNAVKRLGATVTTAVSADDIVSADKLIFPGVGAFGSMMHELHKKGFAKPLKAYLQSGRPFFGICLGMHALFEGSEEAPDQPGLGLLPGRVIRFQIDRAVPHIGWNGIYANQPSPIFKGIQGDERFYFVHAFHVVCDDPDTVLTTTHYGGPFVSAVQQGAVIATQFHPEKSGASGLKLLENFIKGEFAAVLPESDAAANLSRRIVACLDVRTNDDGDLVVTKGDQYDVRESGRVRNLGKPVALAGRYFKEGADEITFLNITGFRDFPLNDLPMLNVLEETSRNVFVPLTIGGGIRDFVDRHGNRSSALDVATAYFRAGADKISIGSNAVDIALAYLQTGQKTGQSAIETISRIYGSQAVVISIDPRRVYIASPNDVSHPVITTHIPGPNGEMFCWYQCTTAGGRKGRNLDAVTLAKACEELGAGEILLNCIDRDGTNSGFDLELINAVKKAVTIPVIASSGAGSAYHFEEVFTRTEAEAALAAGIFHRREVSIAQVKGHLKGKVPVRR